MRARSDEAWMIEFLSSPARVFGSPIYFVSLDRTHIVHAPALDIVHYNFASFVDGVPSLVDPSTIKDDLAQEIFPWLKQ